MRRIMWLILLAVSCVSAIPVLASLRQPAQAATPAPGRSGSKIWVNRYAEFEEFLRTAEIERTTNVSTGVLGIKHAFFKPGGLAEGAALRSIRPGRYNGFWESYKSEIAAYLVDRLLELDLVPPTVERRYDGDIVSVQLWTENTKMLKEILAQRLQPPDVDAYNFQLRRQKVFHNLVGNIDPNPGNILFDPVWNVTLVDCSRCFTNTRTLKYEATAIDRAFLDRVKALDRDKIRRQIGDWVEAGAVDALLLRRDDIVKAFEKLAKQKGANQVILP